MSRTVMAAGRAVAVLTDDALGRRLSVVTKGGSVVHVVVVAITQEEARGAIAAMTQPLEELPREIETRGTPKAIECGPGDRR